MKMFLLTDLMSCYCHNCIDGSPLQRQTIKDTEYINDMNVLRFMTELTETAVNKRLDKKDDEELNILTYDTSDDIFDVSLLMIEDDIFEEETKKDNSEHETTICDKFYKFNLDSCTKKLCEECTLWSWLFLLNKIQKDTE